MRNRIALLFAATAVLASCMKENSLAPDQTNDNLVTIKAVAAETKTLLGETTGEEDSQMTAVVWEAGDKIAVVADWTGPDNKFIEEFSVSGEVNGSSANFSGKYDSSTLTKQDRVNPYAIYPYSALSQDENEGTICISHQLPVEQNGVITSGMLLSSAVLSDEALMSGKTTAVFKNALTLLYIDVPEDVKTVELTASYGIVGAANFSISNTDVTVSSTVTTPATGKLSGVGDEKTVTLSNGGEALDATKTHVVAIYPGNASTLTLKMTGMEGAIYEKTLNNIVFSASEFRTINLTKIFNMDVKDEMFISPVGGECEVKIASVADYTYNVDVTPTAGGDWLSYTLPTKGFHQDVITFSAEENTTGADRTANVTIKWGEDQTRTFEMTQRAVYMDFVNDENGDPIQWEESFGVYASEADASAETNPVKTFTNVFTIGLSDDFSKGTYKLKNLFVVDKYYGEGFQMITNKGGDYYANYDAATGNLTVLKANAVVSYNFPGDIVLTYDSVNKTFSAATLTVTLPTCSAYYASGATRYIGGYAVAVKEEDTNVDAGPLAAFVGTWSESFSFKQYSWSEEATYTNNAVEITIEDGKLVATNILKITPQYGDPTFGTYVGEVSSDGKTVTFGDVDPSSPTHMTFGPVSGFILTLSDDGTTLSNPSALNGTVTNYVATKKADPLAAFVGTWSESFSFKQYSWSEEATYTNNAVEITIEDGKLVATNILKITPQYGDPTFGTYVGEVSSDGKTVTFGDVDPSSPTHMTFGPVSGFILTLSDDGTTLSNPSALNGTVTNYIATKQ